MKVKCAICGKECNLINFLHLRVHGLTTAEYRSLYPDASLCSDELKEVRSEQLSNSNPMDFLEYREKISVANNNPSDETRRKMSENNAMHNPEHRKKVSDGLIDKKFSEEHKKKISKAKEGSWTGNKNPMRNPVCVKKAFETRKRRRNRLLNKTIKIINVDYSDMYNEKGRIKCIICGRYFNYLGKHLRSMHNISVSDYLLHFPDASVGINPMQKLEIRYKFSGENNSMKRLEVRKKVSKTLTGRKRTEEHNKNNSEAQKRNWENPEFIRKMLKAFNVRPNKPETRLNNILQALVPGEYEYNGGFECGISLGRKIPDFVNVNGKKKVIELYGDYWHYGDDPEDRIVLFKRYGYETLVIWEHELNDSSKLTTRILKFEDLSCDKIPRQLSLFEMDEIEK